MNRPLSAAPARPPANEEARLAALRAARLLDTSPEPEFDAAARLAAKLCGKPMALVSLVDGERQWFKAVHGFKLRETPRDWSFCAHAIAATGLFEVTDAAKDPRFRGNPLVTRVPRIRFYAGVPLVTRDGFALGALCVLDRKPAKLGPRERESLTELAGLVAGIIDSRRLTQTWTERLELAMESSEVSFFEFDLPGQTVQLGEGWAAVVGAPPGPMQISMAELRSFVPPEDLERLDAAAMPVIKGVEEQYSVEHRVRHASGEWRWILSSGRVVARDAEGRALRVVGTNRDITERAKGERTLRAREREIRLILDGVSAMISCFDLDSRVVFVNRAVSEMFEQPQEAFRGRHIRELLGEDAYAAVLPHIERVLTGRSSSYERSHLRADGSARKLGFRFEPEVDGDGKVIGWFSLGRDITDEHRARKAEERLHSAIEYLRDSIVLTDPEDRIVFCNRRFRENNAMVAELIEPGRHFQDHLRARAGLGHFPEAAGREAEWLAQRLAERLNPPGPVLHSRADGTWLLTTDQRLPDGGTLTYGLDVTEERRAAAVLAESEARFRAIFESSDAGIAIWTRDGFIVGANAAVGRLLGCAAEELIDRVRYSDTVVPGDRETAALIERLQRGELGKVQLDRRFRARDGAAKWVRASTVPVRGADGMPQYFVSVIIDLSETYEAHERVERLNTELEDRVQQRTGELHAAVKELESFVYSVSHDLRAPLGAISGFAHLLRPEASRALSADGQNLLGRVAENAARMSELLEGLLEFSRLGRQPVARKTVPMGGLVREVIESLERPPKAGIRVDELPDCEGDAVLLRQVWTNLVGNALKYSRAREPPCVEIGFDTAAGAYFVRDNGAGFDMQFADKLFGVFERLHSESEFEGTGIGLAIVERIVRRHEGHVWAESRVGEGATFWFSIPGASAGEAKG